MTRTHFAGKAGCQFKRGRDAARFADKFDWEMVDCRMCPGHVRDLQRVGWLTLLLQQAQRPSTAVRERAIQRAAEELQARLPLPRFRAVRCAAVTSSGEGCRREDWVGFGQRWWCFQHRPVEQEAEPRT